MDPGRKGMGLDYLLLVGPIHRMREFPSVRAHGVLALGSSEGDLSVVQAATASSGKELDYEAEARLVAEARASWERKARGRRRTTRKILTWLLFRLLGSFEDTAKIPPMRFTEKPPETWQAYPRATLQVFSVKVGGLKEGLQWPLHAFGKVAVRDSADRNRNMYGLRPH
ncbi:unnamed protein product [Urochloa humidicola]